MKYFFPIVLINYRQYLPRSTVASGLASSSLFAGTMHGDEDHAHCRALCHPGAQDDRAAPRRNAHGLPLFDLKAGGIRGIHLYARLGIEVIEFRMARESATVPVFEQTSGSEDERVLLVWHLDRRHVLERMELALAAGKALSEEIRRAGMAVIPHRRL